MDGYQALLRRQIRKHFGAEGVPESLRRFVEQVNDAYLQSDVDRRMLERAFEISSQELLDANAELGSALEALAAEAERTAQAARAKDEFLAMLGHELRNPLAPVVTALDLARLKGVSTVDAHDIERPLRQVLRLVDDLLDVARVARGALVLDKRPIEVAIAVRNAVEAAQPAATQRRHALQVHVPKHGLMVNGDETRLTQVVINLLINAVRYTEPGGVIGISSWRDRSEVVLQLRDNGRGIENDMLPHIFDSFGRKRPSESQHGSSGLGLGLTIVRNLVELHGGTVAAYSDGPGTGATFEVRLPTLVVPVSEQRQPRITLSPPLSSRRVLIVDDNREAANLMGEALRLAGHEVALAYEADEALVRAEGFSPDVALLDIGLTDMSGHELGGLLRARSTSQIRLVAITGYGQPSDHEASARAGFQAHLVKPVGLRDLLDVIGD